MTNRGFVELHNPTGFFIVGFGFLLVMLIVAAGGILTRMIERDNVNKRRQMREAMEKQADEALPEAEEPVHHLDSEESN